MIAIRKPFDLLCVSISGDLNMITAEFIKKKMQEHNKTNSDLCQDLNIDKSTVSLWLSSTRDMTKPVKTMFKFYFLYLDLISKKKNK